MRSLFHLRQTMGFSCFRLQAASPILWCWRGQFTVPNRPGSGYREQPPVPDRLKDALSNYGADTRNIFPDEDPTYVPEEHRKKMVTDIITSSSHLRNYSKLDRLRAALDKVHDCPSLFDERWKEVYLFLRTTEMCCEVIRNSNDVFPKGQKLWIEMEDCKEQRFPALLEMPNGMLVLPVFSMEEYMDHYFSLVSAFESCWFPVPRMGSRWETFCAMEFPVTVTGTLRHHSGLATTAVGRWEEKDNSSPQRVSRSAPQATNIPVGILVNPGQRTSKFVTYPEMVYLAEMMKRRVRDRKAELTVPNPKTGKTELIFPEGLITTFDTRKMAMKRLEPREVVAKAQNSSILTAIPPVAQLELHLILHVFEEISEVYIRTVRRPKWRRMLDKQEWMTQIDVIPFSPTKKPPPSFVQALQRWSFMKEFNSDVHIQLTDKAPMKSEEVPEGRDKNHSREACWRVYKEDDGKLLRSMTTFHGITLADSLHFNEPLEDENRRKPYEAYDTY